MNESEFWKRFEDLENEIKLLKIKNLNLNEVIEEKEKEIEEKEKVIEEKEKEIEETINNIKPLSLLLENGMGNFDFMKTVTNNEYTSNYPAIKEEIHSEFVPLRNIYEYLDETKIKITPSLFLNSFNDKYTPTRRVIEFSSEHAIQTKIVLYLQDLIKCTNLRIETNEGGRAKGEDNKLNKEEKKTRKQRNEDIKKRNREIKARNAEKEIRNRGKSEEEREKLEPLLDEEKEGAYIPDIWIIVWNGQYPVLVIEVKSPNTTKRESSSNRIRDKISNVEDLNATGQLYDYMVKEYSFHGKKHCYGILTTLDDFKICWFPECDDSARSPFLIDDFDNNIEYIFDRTICSSRIYKHHEKNLAEIILSVIIKSYYSPVFPSKLFSLEKQYVRLVSENWLWTKYSQENLNNMMQVSLKIPHGNTSNFTVIKYFHSGKFSNVRLCISDNGNIVVVKNYVPAFTFDSEDLREISNLEIECWKKINDIKVYRTSICSQYALVMPLVFNIVEDHKNKRIYIPFNFNYWFFEKGAIPDKLPEYLEKLNRQMRIKPYDMRKIAKVAISKCASKEYIHGDLELRHIAVYLNLDNELIQYEPIMIDFEKMTPNQSPHVAERTMNNEIDKIFRDYENSGYSFY